MKKINTYCFMQARHTLYELRRGSNDNGEEYTWERERVYKTLHDLGYVWDRKVQQWRKRLSAMRNTSNRSPLTESGVVLVRLLGKPDFLDRDRENFRLAFEVIGYTVVSYSKPMKSEDSTYVRVYLKLVKDGSNE